MRMSYPELRVVIFLAGASFLSGIAVAQSYSGPKCLGPFCVDRKVSANMLVERLSPSISNRGTYGTKDRLAFLQIVGASKDEIGAVELSDTSSLKSSEKELAKAINAKNCCKYMLRGFRQGDPLPNAGEKSLSYEGKELMRTTFGIRGGKVSFIWISDAE
jgi:hypothetical protein